MRDVYTLHLHLVDLQLNLAEMCFSVFRNAMTRRLKVREGIMRIRPIHLMIDQFWKIRGATIYPVTVFFHHR